MAILTEMKARIDALSSAYPRLDSRSVDLPDAANELTDTEVLALLTSTCELAKMVELLRVTAVGVASRRSSRELGQAGLAATLGHRTPVELVQSITGGTRAEARRDVDVGSSLLAMTGAAPPAESGQAVDHVAPWDDDLSRALLEGVLTAAQHEAIRHGLGAPARDDLHGEDAAATVWRIAAAQLVQESAEITVEQLARRARQIRDTLDVAGAEERFARRFEMRSFRMWVDAEGVHRARLTFDDEMAAWVRSVIDAALSPRRGGPRFMTDGERAAAKALIEDPRTNEQLCYDLLVDVLRAGALAQASEVFGARQPGVRIVVIKDGAGARDAFGRLLAVGHLEDGGDALPGSVIDRAMCSIGQRAVTVDSCGTPLDVGREKRLFTAKQKIALAVRDGGCLWPGCSVPASYCEAHHCDHWWADSGRTDIDRGVLLCRFHHLLLHNQHYKIRALGDNRFLLDRPPERGDPIELKSRSPLRWAWDPPPFDRAGWRAA